MAGVRVEVQDADAQHLLAELASRTGDARPALDAIGQILVSHTQLRFVDQEGPDGLPWKPLSPVTVARRRGAGVGVKILRDTDRLIGSIDYHAGTGLVTLGSNVTYAAIHQFGQPKGASGRTRRGGPIPWGDIPARPFFGHNDEDQRAVLELLERYLDASQPRSWWQRLIDALWRLF